MRTHAGLNQTVGVCQLRASCPAHNERPGLRSPGSGSRHRHHLFAKFDPVTLDYILRRALTELMCVHVCVCTCFPEGVVTFCWKTAQKRQNPVFSHLRSQLVDTLCWNWQLKVGNTLQTQWQQMKLGKQDHILRHRVQLFHMLIYSL